MNVELSQLFKMVPSCVLVRLAGGVAPREGLLVRERLGPALRPFPASPGGIPGNPARH